MDNKTLIEMVEEAVSKVNTYKYPDIYDVIIRLDEILVALDQSTVTGDHIDDMYLGEDTLYINTSWSARGCECSGQVEIPLFILKEADPLRAAKIYRMGERVHAARSAVINLNRQYTQAVSNLEKLEQEKIELESE